MARSGLHLKVSEVFEPIWKPSRYKAVFGGRASGKSHALAQMLVVRCVTNPGTRVLCAREVQKALRESAKQLIEDKITELEAPGFQIMNDEIRTPGGGRIVFQGMNRQTTDSIKSYEGFDISWVEEAHGLSKTSLQLLRPTIRKPGSELWFSWNPTRKADAVDHFFRGENPPQNAIIVPANWSDNPFFPAEMEAERLHDLAFSPSYRHTWQGEYATVVEGTYYASQLEMARQEGRITELAYDPILERRAYFDLGWSDSTTIWICQMKGQRIHAMDYIEGSGQELGYYINEMRRRGHGDALCYLPHDGAHHHVGKSVDEHMKEAGFRTKIVPNQGRGAAMQRIEAARRLFPRIWFNAPNTDAGVEGLMAYHERRDDKREIGLGPLHDWSSNPADSFGMMCQVYEEPKAALKLVGEIYRAGDEGAGHAWLAS